MAAPWGMILQGIGSAIEGNAAALGGEFDYRVGKYNEALDLQNAQLELEQAAVDEDRSRRLSYKALSSIKAGYGASGVTMEGSPLDVLEESATNAELDALLIRHGGAVRAQRYRASAKLAKFEGRAAKYGGHAKKVSGDLKSVGGMGGMGGMGGG